PPSPTRTPRRACPGIPRPWWSAEAMATSWPSSGHTWCPDHTGTRGLSRCRRRGCGKPQAVFSSLLGGAPDDLQDGGVATRVEGRAREDDLAALDDVEPRGVVGDGGDVGLGKQHGATARHDVRDRLADGRDDRGRESLERLVQEQHLGVEGEGARDREHLAL